MIDFELFKFLNKKKRVTTRIILDYTNIEKRTSILEYRVIEYSVGTPSHNVEIRAFSPWNFPRFSAFPTDITPVFPGETHTHKHIAVKMAINGRVRVISSTFVRLRENVVIIIYRNSVGQQRPFRIIERLWLLIKSN